MTDVSVAFRPPCLAYVDGLQRGVPIQISINWGETFLHLSCLRKKCCDLNLGKGLRKFSFFLFPGSGLNLLKVLGFISIYFEWRDTEYQQLF